MSNMDSIPLRSRREIEVLILVPLIESFAEEFGEAKTLHIVEKVIGSLAKDMGKRLAEQVGGNSLEHYKKVFPFFSRGGMLEYDMVEESDRLAINIKACKFVDMYKELGLEKYGYTLSCSRDAAFLEGFNPDLKFQRTKTIMEGDGCCDFLITMQK